MSRGKKILLGILAFIVVLTLGVVGVGAKLYMDMSSSVQKTYQSVEREQKDLSKSTIREKAVDLQKQEPFSILLLGIDTGALGRTEQGRSDTMMVATVNPESKQTTLVSIPRDTYVPIVGHGTDDKINHAYAFGGPEMSMNTVQNYLDIPIDHFVSINMGGLEQLVDALGGVEVANNQEFTQDGNTFAYGKISLNGEQALAYIRMRKNDPKGDYGRQERQRNVVQAIAKKALSLDGATNYQSILTAVSQNMKTDLTFDNLKTLALDYRNSLDNVRTLQLTGEGFMQDGVSYQRVSQDELARVQKELKQQLGR